MRVERIFLSHLHGDHILGLPGLLQTMSLIGRVKPLAVYGPTGAISALKSMMELCHGGIGFEVIARELKDGIVVEMAEFTIEVCSSEHGVDSLAYVYREFPKPGRFRKEKAISLGIPEGPLFSRIQNGESIMIGDRIIEPNEVCGPERPGRSISYSGDTLPSAAFKEMSRNVDVMIHEATFLESEKELALKYYHSTAKQAAAIAREADVDMLVLTHISTRYKESIKIIKEAKKEFSNVHLAHDFFSVMLSFK